MPGFTTHYLFGINNMRQLKRRDECRTLVKSIQKYRTVFQLGLQGPDIFFYHPASQLRKVKPGSIVHTRWTADFLKCLAEAPELFWKQEERCIAQAYAAGFLGHYMLDVQMHPYVYAKTGMGDELKEKGYADHIGLESDIDACLLMRYTKRLPSEFCCGRTIAFGGKIRSVVADILLYAYNTVFPELSLTKRFLSGAVRSIQLGTMVTYNPHNYKRQAAEMLEKAVFGRLAVSPVIPADHLQYTKDPLNLEHRQWKNPWDTAQSFNSSVPWIIKKASGRYQKALKILNQLYETEVCETEHDVLADQLYQFLGQQSYHTGLDWTLGE